MEAGLQERLKFKGVAVGNLNWEVLRCPRLLKISISSCALVLYLPIVYQNVVVAYHCAPRSEHAEWTVELCVDSESIDGLLACVCVCV